VLVKFTRRLYGEFFRRIIPDPFVSFQAKMMQRAVNSLLPAAGAVAQNQQQRGMATLKMIQMRLKSVKNIQKITQSMKMVSAAKYTRAERDLRACRPIGEGSKQFYEKAEIAAPEGEKKKLYIAITSDRGEPVVISLSFSANQVSLQVCAAPCTPVSSVASAAISPPTPTST
jgi:hypothetical protein